MKLILYNNFSETNQVNKNISKVIELEGSLLESTSIINPIIKIFFNPEGMESYVVEDNQEYIVFNGLKITWDSFIYDYVLAANYAYIPEFNRYYFINDIISVRRNIWQLIMNVDVLMSYKDELLKLDAFVLRNEFDFNKYVKDDLLTYYYDKEVIEYVADKGDKVNTTFSSTPSSYFRNCMLSVINDRILLQSNTVPAPDTSLPNVNNEVSGQSMVCKMYYCSPISVTRLARLILNDDTLANFIISAILLPFNLRWDYEEEEYLRLGDQEVGDDLTKVTVYPATPNLSEYYVIADFTIIGDSFMDYEPYTSYDLWIPYLGWVKVNADDILNNRIIVYYVVDFLTGNAQVTIYDITNGKNVYTSNCQLGIKIGFSSTNAREVKDNETSNNIGLTVGLLSSSLAIIGGAVTYNPVAVGGGAVAMGSTIAKFIQNNNTNYSRASGSLSSSNGGVYASQEVKIRKTKLKPKNYNDDYAKLFGKPLNEYRKLSTLHGFTTVGNIHIENVASATRNEHDQLKALLEEGIIL